MGGMPVASTIDVGGLACNRNERGRSRITVIEDLRSLVVHTAGKDQVALRSVVMVWDTIALSVTRGCGEGNGLLKTVCAIAMEEHAYSPPMTALTPSLAHWVEKAHTSVSHNPYPPPAPTKVLPMAIDTPHHPQRPSRPSNSGSSTD